MTKTLTKINNKPVKSQDYSCDLARKFSISIRALIHASSGVKDKGSFITASESFIKGFDTMWTCWGPKHTLAYYKELRLCYTRTLSGSPLQPNDLKYSIGLTKEGYPRKLGPIIGYLRRGITPQENRLLMTLITIGRTYEIPPAMPDLLSITEENESIDDFCEDFIDDFIDFVKVKIKQHYKSPIKYNFDKFYLSLSHGPNGPALRTSLWEASQLPKDFLKIIDEVSPGLHERLEFLRLNLNGYEEWNSTFNLNKSDKFLFGKLSIIPDKEGKTRVIALLNYWAQCLLKPIHDQCSDILKVIPYDCTHNQGNFKNLLELKSDQKWHSIDLKDATDRFPRKIQEAVIKSLFGPKVAKAWTWVMTQSFTLGWNKSKTVKYSVGQPMGAYSSFPVFALTHGLIVSYLAENLDISSDCFRILGDDILIRDDKLAEKYIKVLKAMGVPYSKTKTMQSVHTFEFAKRWFHHGVEISPFPVSALHESITSFSMLAETFRTADEKGWYQNFCAGPGLVRTLLKFHGMHPVFTRKFLEKYEMFTSFPNFNLSEEDNTRNWVKFLRLSNHYVSCVGWKDHVHQTLKVTLKDASRELLHGALKSLASQSDDLWRCLYYAGLSPSRGIKLELQKVLEWANPLLAVLRQQADQLDILSASQDKTNNPASSQEQLAQFLKDFCVLRVFSLENLKKERTHKMVIKARARLATKCQQILRKRSLDS